MGEYGGVWGRNMAEENGGGIWRNMKAYEITLGDLWRGLERI